MREVVSTRLSENSTGLEVSGDSRHLLTPAVVSRLQRRTLWIVTVTQMFGGAGLAAGVTVGALMAKEMLGGNSTAGLPVALFTLGSALAAFLVGRFSQRSGRRTGLGLGFGAGAIGAVGVIAAAALDNVAFLLLSLFVYGAGSATNLQARYAGTDLSEPEQRARAVSVSLVATTLGAVVGPVVVEPMGSFAEALGLPSLTGSFILAAAAYAVAAAVLFAFLRPDPFLVARALAESTRVDGGAGNRAASAELIDPPSAQSTAQTTGGSTAISSMPDAKETGGEAQGSLIRQLRPGAWMGAIVMLVAQLVMVAVMTMTPVHMDDHGHSLGAVGMVIGFHIGAMYLPSPLVGWFVDRVGRVTMVVVGGVTLLASGVLAAVVPGDSVGLTVIALMVLGLGWNIGLITGTALVVDATDPVERPRIQGSIDVTIALAGAGGGALSGLVVANASYAVLALGSGVLSLVVIPALLILRQR